MSRLVPLEALPSAGVRRFVLTGVGSSAAHARYLAFLLRDVLELDARVLPLSAFLDTPRAHSDDVLIVVSQGLSPNARLALRHRLAYRHVVMLTAATEDGARAAGDDMKARLLADLRTAGVTIAAFPAGENEYETLVRVVGPMAGYVTALHVSREIARVTRVPANRAAALSLDVDALVAALEAAPSTADRALERVDLSTLDRIALLTSGGHGELVENVRAKVLEGMLLPAPPVWDLLDVAHGPLQQAYAADTTFVALTRPDATDEAATVDRIERALPSRGQLVRLPAALPGPFAIFEHEALMNELMLRFIAARGIDQIGWPGRGQDRELYDLGSSAAERPAPASGVATRAAATSPVTRLETLTWPDVDALLSRGGCTAVIPLGSTEQHGPHLPYATDTLIADALAARFCARVPGAVQLPAIALGCSREHLAFPGTVDLRPETLQAVLADVLRSVRLHGFRRAFIFSAHGGNCMTLEEALPELRADCAPLEVIAYTDLDEVTGTLHRLSESFGVAPEASGHHGGELETSIMRALHPELVRVDRAGVGLLAQGDAQRLFYPSLRDHASTGVVGDPRLASPDRANAYVDGWVDLLVATYRRAAA